MSLDADALNVVVKAMALTDVWLEDDDGDPGWAQVHKPELEALMAAVEPFRHSLLNPLHVRSECEACAPGGSQERNGGGTETPALDGPVNPRDDDSTPLGGSQENRLAP